jgi:hypothetical protein
MEIFRDMCVYGSEQQIAALMGEVERSLPRGWVRHVQAEQNINSLVGHRGGPTYFFSCTEEVGRPAATVCLMDQGAGAFRVSNVVPRQLRQLTYSQYNRILEELHAQFAPAAAKMGVRTQLTPAEVDLEHWMSGETADKLRRFSRTANKSTGSAHPGDQAKWMEFIVAAQRENISLSASTLRRWLIEVEGWSPEVADSLASEYDFGKNILTFVLEHRMGA